MKELKQFKKDLKHIYKVLNTTKDTDVCNDKIMNLAIKNRYTNNDLIKDTLLEITEQTIERDVAKDAILWNTDPFTKERDKYLNKLYSYPKKYLVCENTYFVDPIDFYTTTVKGLNAVFDNAFENLGV